MVTIQKATAADLSALAACSRRHFTTEQWTAEQFRGALDKGSIVLTAKEKDTLVGFGVADVVQGEGYIGLIAVDGPYRRQGIAKAMVETMAEQTDVLLLDVRQSNVSAIAFYQSMGFVTLAVRPGAYRNPTEDMVTMQRVTEGIKEEKQ